MKKIIWIIIAAACLCACGKEEIINESQPDEAKIETGSITEAEEYITWDEKELSVSGLNKEYEIWFLADSHMTLCNSDEAEEIIEYAAQRTAGFVNEMGVSSDMIFSEFIDTANEEKPDMVLFGGDILDFPSEANVSFLKAELDRLEVPFVFTMGNHDWTFPWEYMTEAGQRTSAFDTADAMIASDGDIKTSVRSAKDLLMLMRKLDLEVPSLEVYEKIYTPIQVAVNSELQIDQMMIHYFLDGKSYATASLGIPEELTEDYAENLEFIFPKIDWILNKEEHHTLELELDIFMKDGTVYHVPKTESMSFELDETYMYDLIGNPEEGFRLELKE